MPEHRSPEQGIGGGDFPGSVNGSSGRENSIPIAGRSAECRQSPRLVEGEQRPIARSVRNAPTFARAFVLK